MRTRTIWPRITLTALLGLLTACGPSSLGAKLGFGGGPPIDSATLNSEIDRQIGGLDTCVIILDTQSGRRIYAYGQAETCVAPLPPCDLFDIPLSLIGLDQGLITPGGVVKYDGSPQPVSAWRTDANLGSALSVGIGWWFSKLATGIGHDRMVAALRDLDYGDHNAAGPPGAFWMGPQAGGALTTTEGQQADFMRRFYAGDLKIKPPAIAAVQAATLDETRPDPKGGSAVISGRVASCASTADGARTVSWWAGRLKTGSRDLSFSASIEGPDAPPGLEIEQRLKGIFTDAGLLPPGG
jgi:beta-lactamase class D